VHGDWLTVIDYLIDYLKDFNNNNNNNNNHYFDTFKLLYELISTNFDKKM